MSGNIVLITVGDLQSNEFPPFQGDRNSLKEKKIAYIRNGIITKRLTIYETKDKVFV